MPTRTHYAECLRWEVAYNSDEEIYDCPPISNDGKYVSKNINRKKLIHATIDISDDSDEEEIEEEEECEEEYSGNEEDSEDESMASEMACKPAAAVNFTPIQTISDLVFKDTLFYDGFCFDGVAKQFSGVSGFKVDGVGAMQIPLTDAQVEKLLSLTKPRVVFNPEFSAGLDQLKAELAKRIGCSKTLFKLEFRVMLVHKAGKEIGRHVDKELIRNQFGTLFVQPPMKHTGGEMKVSRKLSVEGDQAEEIRLEFGANAETQASNWHFGFISAEAEHEFARVTSGSRVMFVFAAAWNKKQQLQFPGPEKIDQVAAQLELQSAKGEFVVAFLGGTYENFKNIGQQVLKEADRSLLRQLEAANDRLEKPFKVVLVSIVRNFVYKEYDNTEDMEQLFSDLDLLGRIDSVDAEWEFKECTILQQWYGLDGKPWPQQPKANLELMTNVLNPKKRLLKQLWGAYATQKYHGIPSTDNESNSESEEEEKEDFDFYMHTATKTVTYKQSLLVLWPSELAIKHVIEFEGWDVAFKTVIGKSPDSAALTSLLQLFKEKKGYKDSSQLLKAETIHLVYRYIAKNSMLDLLPVYINVFYPTESAFKPIFLTSNEEIWKITESALLSNLNDSQAVCIVRLLKMAQKEQAPNERRYKLLQACLRLSKGISQEILSLVLPLADETLVKMLGDKFFTMKTNSNVRSFLKALLAPEIAPLREKFWTMFAPRLEQCIDLLKATIAKPFDEKHPDLEAIFPKESSQAKWLMHCQAHYESESHSFYVENNDLEKAKQVEEQLKTYNLLFSAKLSTYPSGKVEISLKKTENFKRYLEKLMNNKVELQMLVEMEPPPMKDDDDGDLEPLMKKQKLQ